MYHKMYMFSMFSMFHVEYIIVYVLQCCGIVIWHVQYIRAGWRYSIHFTSDNIILLKDKCYFCVKILSALIRINNLK